MESVLRSLRILLQLYSATHGCDATGSVNVAQAVARLRHAVPK
jgi:hypothetical protein